MSEDKNKDKVKDAEVVEESTTALSQKTEKSVVAKDVSSSNKTQSLVQAGFKTIEDVKSFAEMMALSSLGDKFKRNRKIEGTDDYEEYIDTNSMVAAILTGNEIGFTPMVSLSFGKQLDKDAIQKVLIGRDLGLPATMSLQRIHVMNAGGKETVIVDYHVIDKLMIECGVTREILMDAAPVNLYNPINTDLLVEMDEDKFFIFVEGKSTLDEAKEQQLLGKKAVVFHSTTRKTSIRFTREVKGVKQSIIKSYTLQQATDADLYEGVNSKGATVKGKGNWNNHPATMLNKMCVNLAKSIVADRLHGLLGDVEVGYTDFEEI